MQEHFGAVSAFDVHDWLARRFPSLAGYVPEQDQIVDSAAQLAKATGAYLVGGATQLTASTATFLLNLFVMLYAMFYFLRDGGDILRENFILHTTQPRR